MKLDGILPTDRFNIFDVEIKYSIKVEQRYPTGTGICSLVLEPINYAEPKIDAAVDSLVLDKPDLLLSVMCNNIPDYIFSTTATGQPSKLLADFPLFRLLKSFTAIQIRLTFCLNIKMEDPWLSKMKKIGTASVPVGLSWTINGILRANGTACTVRTFIVARAT